MIRLFTIGALCVMVASAAAHEGVKNPVVLKRMEGMTEIAAHLKVIGDMAKGEAAFDADAARAAASGIATHAAATPALFAAREDDPNSEAKSAIWESFEDFTRLSLELEDIATDLSSTISAPEDLRPALQRLGQNCKACHSDYRE